ncbi:MAG: hypothetical protein QOI38_483 [Sphingomonadales bacterium]|jgi:hypothetical protein|nr:hypothetical protein [Sphingomonadales bacterium]
MRHESIRPPEAAADAQAAPADQAVADAAAPPEPPNDPSFATAAEEDAFWSGVATGARMAGRDLPALPARGGGAPIVPRAPDEGFAEAVEIRAGCRPPGGRVRRHDGWTPARMIHFLEILAATGCVADACKAVGMSVSAAYALRDRREGRAWGIAWQAVLQNRARHRLSDENLGRAMNGCVEQIVRDGVVVAERRRHDNRLSMAVLSRLDRQAERTDSDESRLLRAVSEDIEDFYDVLDAGGDADAFIEARRPRPPAPPEPRRPYNPYEDLDAIDLAARVAGVDGWSHSCPEEVPIADLDPLRRELWDTEGWIRAERSHYREWLDFMARAGRLPSTDCAAEFEELRGTYYEAREAAEIEVGDEADEEDVAARAAEIFLAGLDDAEVEGVEWQASTSSTSPDEEGDP